MLKNIDSYKNVMFIFDYDGVLGDTWGEMRKAYEFFIGKTLSDQEWLDINRDYDLHPRKYMDFGEFFASSDVIRSIPPLKGMPELVSTLFYMDAEMCVLTCIEKEAEQARQENLDNFFGGVFSDLHCIGKESKTSVLSYYDERYWRTIFIDDSIHYIKESIGIVTHPIWMDVGYLSHRAHELSDDVYRADSVDALCDLLLS